MPLPTGRLRVIERSMSRARTDARRYRSRWCRRDHAAERNDPVIGRRLPLRRVEGDGDGAGNSMSRHADALDIGLRLRRAPSWRRRGGRPRCHRRARLDEEYAILCRRPSRACLAATGHRRSTPIERGRSKRGKREQASSTASANGRRLVHRRGDGGKPLFHLGAHLRTREHVEFFLRIALRICAATSDGSSPDRPFVNVSSVRAWLAGSGGRVGP